MSSPKRSLAFLKGDHSLKTPASIIKDSRTWLQTVTTQRPSSPLLSQSNIQNQSKSKYELNDMMPIKYLKAVDEFQPHNYPSFSKRILEKSSYSETIKTTDAHMKKIPSLTKNEEPSSSKDPSLVLTGTGISSKISANVLITERNNISRSADVKTPRKQPMKTFKDHKPKSGGYTIRSSPREDVSSSSPISNRSNEALDESYNDMTTFAQMNKSLFNLIENCKVNTFDDAVIEKHLDLIETTIRNKELFGKKKWPGRMDLLQNIFKLFELPQQKLHLMGIRLALLLNLGSTNLINIAKLLYSFTKSSDVSLINQVPDLPDIIISTLKEHTRLGDKLMTFSNQNNETLRSYLQPNIDSMLYLYGCLKWFISTKPIEESVFELEPAKMLTVLYETQSDILSIILNVIEVTLQRGPQYVFGLQSTKVKPNAVNAKTMKSLREALHHVLVQISGILCELSSAAFDRDIKEPVLNVGLLKFINPLEKITFKEFAGNIVRSLAKMSISDASLRLREEMLLETESHSNEYQVLLNWFRFLGHLTEHHDFCLMLVPSEDSPGLCNEVEEYVALCNTVTIFLFIYQNKREFLIRVLYLLGNLSSKCPLVRKSVLGSVKNATQFWKIFKNFVDLIITTERNNNQLDLNYDRLDEDIIVKMTRLLANCAMEEEVTFILLDNGRYIDLTKDLIETMSKNTQRPANIYELVSNSLYLLNNFVFHTHNKLPPKRLIAITKSLLESMSFWIKVGNGEAEVIFGALRVLGNLTRVSNVRDWLSRDYRSDNKDRNNDGEAFIGFLLDCVEQFAEWPDVIYACTGILVNFLTEKSNRTAFAKLNGMPIYSELLQDFQGDDSELTTLICKLMWNYLDSSGDKSFVDENTKLEIISVLNENIEKLKGDLSNSQNSSEATEFLSVTEALVTVLKE